MSERQPIRVMSVDDHELVRNGIRFSFLAFDDIEMVAEAPSGSEAVRICKEIQPDVVLMDMLLSGDIDGVAAIRAIKECCPDIKVLALSTFYNRELVEGAMQAGAVSYLIKGESVVMLADAIRAANAGQTTMAGKASRALFEAPKLTHEPGSDLTEREQEVLTLLTEGLSNPQISEQMYLSVAAVKYHVSGILSKLGVRNRTMAAKLALEHNLVKKD